MTADEFNALYPIGTPVTAYPGFRPEDDPQAEAIVTTTRSRARVLGGHTDVVWVHGHGACIALTHIDVTPGAAYGVVWPADHAWAEATAALTTATKDGAQ